MRPHIQQTLRELREQRFVSERERLVNLEGQLLRQRTNLNRQISEVRSKLNALDQKRVQDQAEDAL
jgi:hypothetical protein